MAHKIKRRDFLKLAAGTGLLASFPAPAFAQQQNVNSRLRFACIGIGGMGTANLNEIVRIEGNESIAAICDADENILNANRERFPRAKSFRDFRRLFDEAERDFDAIVVSTPDHTHAAASIMGMKLGKHCYTEKPMAHNVTEVREMMRIARETGVATQHGTQIHASDNYRRVVELVQSNAIGNVSEVHVWCNTRWGGRPFSTDTPPVPDHLDWELWLGPAPYRPYHPQYFGGAWRCYWAFGNGTLGDMACHYMDLPFWALGLVMGVFERTVKGETSKTVRYMISDLPSDQVARLVDCFRSHWSIENKLHWVLDVSLGEDGNRTRCGNGAKNLGK